jgi:soluble P-type ATPase
MIEIEIPGFGPVRLEHMVSDFTGTLSCDGMLLEGVAEKIREVSGRLTVDILTSDTFGTAWSELEGLPCTVHLISGSMVGADARKEDFVRELGPEGVVAIGNGCNDRKMLKAARLGIAVTGTEGCSTDALMAADIHVCRVIDAFDLLLKPKRCKATLRF